MSRKCDITNNYCPGGFSPPVPWAVVSCDAGKYLSTIPSTSTDGVCTVCEAGFFCSGGTRAKLDCPRGSFCPSMTSQPIGCSRGFYSANPSASSSSVCAQCSAGSFSGETGATSCSICDAGSVSTAGASGCTPCNPPSAPIIMFQDQKGQSACKSCALKQNCPVGQTGQACTSISNFTCNSCEPIANCIYSGAGGCISNDIPTCNCDKGFEKRKISSKYECVQCEQGKYKPTGGDNCIVRDTTPCYLNLYAVFGTRIENNACLHYPITPYNSFAIENTWTCNRGFEKA